MLRGEARCIVEEMLRELITPSVEDQGSSRHQHASNLDPVAFSQELNVFEENHGLAMIATVSSPP